jgi:hypothetical protein
MLRVIADLAGVLRLSPIEAEAYLLGASHDASFSALHQTTRFTQKDPRWLVGVAALLKHVGFRSWLYQEGQRGVYCLETSWKAVPTSVVVTRHPDHYLRGYFDSDGGIPRDPDARFYIQFVQKDRDDLMQAKQLLERLGISCGELHNPSARVDPNYWRFFVRARSHDRFVRTVGSWHPRKRGLLVARMPLDARTS